jgi:hypothetical protein
MSYAILHFEEESLPSVRRRYFVAKIAGNETRVDMYTELISAISAARWARTSNPSVDVLIYEGALITEFNSASAQYHNPRG